MPTKYRLSVKAFILDENEKLLIIKRAENLKNTPNVWELPGGKIIPGKNPFEELTKETKNETNLKINILFPLSVRHFERANGEVITMLVFCCNPVKKQVKLGTRHSDYKWVTFEEADKLLSPFFKYELIMYKNVKNNTHMHYK